MANHAWISGTRFYFFNNVTTWSVEGISYGATNAPVRSIWLEGNNVCYVDDYGTLRKVYFDAYNPPDFSGATRRAMWLPAGELLHIRTAQGEHRRLVHQDYNVTGYTDHSDEPGYTANMHKDTIGINENDLLAAHRYAEYTLQTGHANTVNYEDEPYEDHGDHGDTAHSDDTQGGYGDYDEGTYYLHTNSTYNDSGYTDEHNNHSNSPYYEYDDTTSYDDAPYHDRGYSDYARHANTSHSDYSDSGYSDGGYSKSHTDDWDNHTDGPYKLYSDAGYSEAGYSDSGYKDYTKHSNTPYDQYEDTGYERGAYGDEGYSDTAKHLNQAHGDYSDTPYLDYAQYGDHSNVSHGNYPDTGYSDKGYSDHTDITLYHHDDYSDYADYMVYQDLPHQDYTDYEDSRHSNWSNSAGSGHLDSPRREN